MDFKNLIFFILIFLSFYSKSAEKEKVEMREYIVSCKYGEEFNNYSCRFEPKVITTSMKIPICKSLKDLKEIVVNNIIKHLRKSECFVRYSIFYCEFYQDAKIQTKDINKITRIDLSVYLDNGLD